MKEQRDIEWLVNWAFQKQRVEDAMRSLVPSAPTISPSAMLQLLELGVRVDTSSAGEKWGSAQCHDDAVVIYDMVRRLPREAAGLVVLHGRIGTRPDWCPGGIGCEVPMLDKRGRPRRIWRDPARRKGDLGPMLQWRGHRAEAVEFHRAQYAVWHAALATLTDPFNAEAVDFHASGPNTSAEPWSWGVRQEIKLGLDAGANI
jgi:hypothetical protein